jgi:hypothetical protein
VLREADVALFPNRCEGGTNNRSARLRMGIPMKRRVTDPSAMRE